MNTKSTDLDREQLEKDHPEFTRFFWKNLGIAIGIGFSCTLGIITSIVHADAIDRFFADIIKAIFI